MNVCAMDVCAVVNTAADKMTKYKSTALLSCEDRVYKKTSSDSKFDTNFQTIISFQFLTKLL